MIETPAMYSLCLYTLCSPCTLYPPSSRCPHLPAESLHLSSQGHVWEWLFWPLWWVVEQLHIGPDTWDCDPLEVWYPRDLLTPTHAYTCGPPYRPLCCDSFWPQKCKVPGGKWKCVPYLGPDPHHQTAAVLWWPQEHSGVSTSSCHRVLWQRPHCEFIEPAVRIMWCHVMSRVPPFCNAMYIQNTCWQF